MSLDNMTAWERSNVSAIGVMGGIPSHYNGTATTTPVFLQWNDHAVQTIILNIYA